LGPWFLRRERHYRGDDCRGGEIARGGHAQFRSALRRRRRTRQRRSKGGCRDSPRFTILINGEPTENRLALGSKGALRYEITALGKLAHSAYPELGHSAIHTLLDVLHDIRRIPLPEDGLLGRSTLNVGTIDGGRAPNVVADLAEAESCSGRLAIPRNFAKPSPPPLPGAPRLAKC